MAAWKPGGRGGKPFFLLAMAGEEMLGMIPRVGLGSGELISTAGSFRNIQWYRDCRVLLSANPAVHNGPVTLPGVCLCHSTWEEADTVTYLYLMNE